MVSSLVRLSSAETQKFYNVVNFLLFLLLCVFVDFSGLLLSGVHYFVNSFVACSQCHRRVPIS